MLKDYFEFHGYLVYTAMNGAEALKEINSKPDIILLDINMPDMDGLEVCRTTRDHVSCPIIFLTARIEETDAIIGFQSGGMIVRELIRQKEQRQLDTTFLIGGAAGLALAVPVSFGIWSLLALFISYTEGVYRVGWKGLLIAGGLWILAWVILRIRNAVQIARLDVIKNLRSSSECEEVKDAHPALGIIGFAAVPLQKKATFL